jgi:hypothetical protein
VGLDPAAGVDLRSGDVAVEIDAPRHHDESTRLDPDKILRSVRRLNDPAVLDPDVAHERIGPIGRIVDQSTANDEPGC